MQYHQTRQSAKPHRCAAALAFQWLGLLAALVSALVSAGCTAPVPQPRPRSLETLVHKSLALSRQHAQQQARHDARRQRALAEQRLQVVKDSGVRLAAHVEPLPEDASHASGAYQLVQGIVHEGIGEVPLLQPPVTGPPVSDIFEETDVRQALISLASQAKMTVIVDDQVSGVTSAMIDNEPFEAALRKVLLPLGLVYRKRGREYLVGVPDPASSLFPLIAERFEFRPLHLSPSELAAVLPERFKPFLRGGQAQRHPDRSARGHRPPDRGGASARRPGRAAGGAGDDRLRVHARVAVALWF